MFNITLFQPYADDLEEALQEIADLEDVDLEDLIFSILAEYVRRYAEETGAEGEELERWR